MRRIIVGMLISLCTYVFAHSDTWTRTYGGIGFDFGREVQETEDGGFIIVGWTNSFGAGDYDVYLIRTDANGDTLWTKTYGGINSDGGNSIQQTRDGGFIIVGSTRSFGAGESDVYLIRTDANGDTLWTKTYGGTDYDWGYSIQQMEDGGFIIVGGTNSFGAGDYDVYLIRTDANGDTLWTKTYGGADREWGYSIQQMEDGGFIVAGFTRSFGAGGSDVYLIRTDANGDALWIKTYGGVNSDWGNSIQQTKDGGFIIVGGTNSFGAGDYDVYLIRTDANGDTLWTRTYGSADYDDCGASVQQTKDGGFIIVGGTRSFGAGDYDVYLIRTDANGDTLWTRTYGSADYDDYGASVQQTEDGGFIIVGRALCSYETGESDVYLIRIKPTVLISPNGGEIWVNGSIHNIIWRCDDSIIVDHYRLLYSTNSGADYSDTIAHNIANIDTAYLWTLPVIASNSCRVKIQALDSLNNVISEDASDSDFVISPQITMPDTTVVPGDTVRLAIYSTDITGFGITSCDITLTFNPSLLSALDAERGSLIPEDWNLQSNPSTGQIQIGLAGATALNGSGSIAIVPFIINPEALPEDSSIIHFSDFRFNEGNVYAYPIDGKVTVAGELVTITGRCLYWSNNAGVSDVRIELSGDHSSIVFTDSFGVYTITTASGGNYTVTPYKENTTALPAISAYDASLILKHMVQYDTLTGYQLIAAEVSGDSIIMSYDAALILRYSVGMIQHFPVGDWAFRPTSRSYNQLDSSVTDENYTAILYGDVSGNYSQKDRKCECMGDTILVSIPRIFTQGRDTVNVPIEVEDVTGQGIISCDITLTFDSTVARALSAITGPIIPSNWLIESRSFPGEIRIALAGADELSGSGDLIYIPFVLDTTAEIGDSTVIHFDNFVFNDGSIPVELQDGVLLVGTSIEEMPNFIPNTFFLAQNYPNPMVSGTCIKYGLPRPVEVTLAIYDLMGRRIRTLVAGKQKPGSYKVYWNGTNDNGQKVVSGVYFYCLEAGEFKAVKRLTILR